MADFKLSANIEVRKQAPLDDRLAKMTKADLIKPESWASDNGTYYVYKYMIVGTADGLFMLMDVNKLLDEDFSGWKRIGNESIPTGGLTEDEVKDLLDVILADYVQKEEGKGLSTNDYTNGDKAKLDGLKNYDDTNIKAQLEGLQNSLNVLVEGDATSAIESFNEIVAFLASIEDKQTLSGIINGINQSISNVESNIPTKISELDNDKGFITLNEVPKQDLSEYAKKSDIPTDYLKEIPEEYITETELSNKGYIAANEVNVQLDKKVDKVDGKQLSTEDFTTLLKNKLDGLSNYDDTEISQAVSKLRTDLDALVSGDTTTAIKTFNEVVAFLDGISDTEDLSGIIASIEQQIAAKQDIISDLATIREGAAKGATAIQEHQDLSGKQDKLVSGTNIKTINGQDVLGEGDIVIEGGNSEANVGAVDTDDFVEEPDLAKYLTTKPQSFTDEEKQQVKDNLGISAEDFDLSDYATKEELKGKEDKKILIDHGTDDTTYALTPNVFHKWGEVANLSLTLAEPSDTTVYNEYMFEFISGSTSTTLSLPDTIQWVSLPSVEANTTYQCSIVNNVGIIVSSYNL